MFEDPPQTALYLEDVLFLGGDLLVYRFGKFVRKLLNGVLRVLRLKFSAPTRIIVWTHVEKGEGVRETCEQHVVLFNILNKKKRFPRRHDRCYLLYARSAPTVSVPDRLPLHCCHDRNVLVTAKTKKRADAPTKDTRSWDKRTRPGRGTLFCLRLHFLPVLSSPPG